MKCLAITSKGIEDIACIEIKELINADCRAEEGCVLFKAKSTEDLFKLSYKSQSIDRAILLIADSGFNTIGNIADKVKKAKFPAIKAKTFAVKCQRLGFHEFSSPDIEKELAVIAKNMGIGLDYKSPEILLFCYIVNNHFYFGIDFAGLELQKRQYKIYAQPNSLRATIAYSLVRFSGYKKGEVLLDPFAGDGMIAIEAALFSSGLSPNYYGKDKFMFTRYIKNAKKILEMLDKRPGIKGRIMGYDSLFKHIDYTRKNAKIAGIHDFITLSKIELEWLDVKLKEKSIDRIATKLPSSIKSSNDKLLNEFFYQAEFILRDKGIISVITHYSSVVKECASKRNFRLIREKNVWSGKQELFILVFKKG